MRGIEGSARRAGSPGFVFLRLHEADRPQHIADALLLFLQEGLEGFAGQIEIVPALLLQRIAPIIVMPLTRSWLGSPLAVLTN